jgi:hypothetical protein
MILLLLQIFFVSFLINLLWEVTHSQFYNTCLKIKLKKYIPLIIGASIKDGLGISLLFWISTIIFKNVNVLQNSYHLLFFTLVALVSSFIDEKVSLKMKRWEYSEEMPRIFGVGFTPLLQIAITGILTFLYVFLA